MRNLLKKILPKILLILVVVQVASCSGPVSSPRIWIFNSSDNYLYRIKGNWNGYKLVGHDSSMSPGQIGSENFYLKRTITTELLGKTKSQLFGPIRLEWENATGKKIVKNFEITKEQLPYYYNYQGSAPYHKFGRTTFDNVYFFLTQDDAEMFVRPDGPQLPEVDKRWDQANKFSDEYRKICPKGYGCKLNSKSKQPINSDQKFIDSQTDLRGVQVVRILVPDINNPKIGNACSKKDLELYQLEIMVAESKKYGAQFKEIPKDQKPSSKCLKAIRSVK